MCVAVFNTTLFVSKVDLKQFGVNCPHDGHELTECKARTADSEHQ